MWPFRFATHGKRGLRMMVVTLVSSGPKNGVEIMDGVETMTRGWWRPTPGSIYPLLTKMVDEGTLSKMPDGRYELTQNARKEYDFSFGPKPVRGGVDQTMSELQSLVSFLEDVKASKGSLKGNDEALRSLAERLKQLAQDPSPAASSS